MKIYDKYKNKPINRVNGKVFTQLEFFSLHDGAFSFNIISQNTNPYQVDAYMLVNGVNYRCANVSQGNINYKLSNRYLQLKEFKKAELQNYFDVYIKPQVEKTIAFYAKDLEPKK